MTSTKDYRAEAGDVLNGVYVLLRILGSGANSTVWLTWHPNHLQFYAIKVMRRRSRAEERARNEIEALKTVRGKPGIVQYVEDFTVRSGTAIHVCIVTEVLGPNLATLIESTNYEEHRLDSYRQYLPWLRTVARGILEGLRSFEECQLAHSNVKPENVVVTRSQREICDDALEVIDGILRKETFPEDVISCGVERVYLSSDKIGSLERMKAQIERLKRTLRNEGNEVPQIKLVDLGNTVAVSSGSRSELQSSLYRSPEVILCEESGLAAGIFSAACTLFELATGKYLLEAEVPEGCNHHQRCFAHLQLMARIINNFDFSSLKDGKWYSDFFDEFGKFKIYTTEDPGTMSVNEDSTVAEQSGQHSEVQSMHDSNEDVWYQFGRTAPIISARPTVGFYRFEMDENGCLLLIIPNAPSPIKVVYWAGVVTVMRDEYNFGPRLLNELISCYGWGEPLARNFTQFLETVPLCPIRNQLVTLFGWEAKKAKQFARFLMFMLRIDPKKRATTQECLEHPWLSEI
uniref:non-specific serine/threonine protein kinase n=1 Tax=Steinernema glaseri TaxID=37863 RepID=A0A1I8ATD6_9BILA